MSRLRALSVCLVALATFAAPRVFAVEFLVAPAQVTLDGNFAQAQLLVTALVAPEHAADTADDLTHKATYQSADATIVSVTAEGRLLGLKDGQTQVVVTVDGIARPIEVTVQNVKPVSTPGFTEDIQPVMAKLGCNAGACHASQHGKGGFILTVFGYDPLADRNMMVRDRMQRRINFLQPEESLLLRKPLLDVPHGGGRRLERDSIAHQMLTAWIASGAPEPKKDAPKIVSLAVSPTRRIGEPGLTQQLRVVATYNNGQSRDVTGWARFDSMDDGVVSVTSEGKFTAVGRGQGPVMVRYEGQADICMVVVPYSSTTDLSGWKDQNYVDTHAARKFREIGISPSPLCDDATFMRRAYLDAIGTLPSVQETTAFLDSTEPDKRTKLVDRLLGLTGDPAQDIYTDAYSAYWTLKWADLIRNNSDKLGDQGMWSLYNWMRSAFRTNMPFDKFVREMITAQGSIFSNGPANYYRISDNPTELAESTAQLFLGVRLQCAQCHHHPFEKYSQHDYYGFSAFFARVGNKRSQEFGIFDQELIVMVRSSGDVRHPRTGEVMKPTPLEGEAVDHPLDRRIALADWLASPKNEAFSRNVVNRYCGYLLGRGLVEPVDDMRATNPPTNPEMMADLSREFTESGFNLKVLMKTIMTSRLYQTDWQPTAENAGDTRFYSHFAVKRVTAEPLLDGIDLATESPTKYPNLPQGTRAIELPDAEYQNQFLMTFGKPKRASVCECERVRDENLAQALHTLNGDILATKIADPKGRITRLLTEKKSHEEIVTELYLATLSRKPSPAEMEASKGFLAESPSPAECYQDLLWALINSKQFLFVH